MNTATIYKGVTLGELLQSRDDRCALERQLLRAHRGDTVVVLTVVMPGSVKRDNRSLAVAHAAVAAIRREFGIPPIQERDLSTGYEAYWIISGNDHDAVKRRTCSIEESHPLGRLFDIDVLRPDGTPVSRRSIGIEPRRCLVCDREARFCMRNHTHTADEIQQAVNRLLTFNS